MRKYDSYKESGVEWIGEIPSHWGRTKTKYFSNFSNGYSFKSEDWVDSGIPVIRMSNIGDDGKIKLSDKNLKYVKEEFVEETSNFLIMKGDILISMTDMNPLMLWLGSTIIFNEEGDWLLNQRVGNIRITNDSVSRKYYHYLSNTDVIRNQLKVSVYPNVQTNLSTEPIKNEIVFLPPLSEQQQIVSFLDTKTSLIDSLIEKTQRKIELLKEKRTSLINEVVTKGLNPNVEMKDSGVEWIGEIPSHWERTKLKRYVSIFTGYSFKSDWFGEEGIPVIRISNIQDGFIDFTKSVYLTENYLTEYPDYVVKRDDTLICLTGSLTGKVGKFNHEVGLLNQRVGKIIVRGNKVLKGFIDKVFFFQKFQGLIKEMGEGISENFPNVSHLDVVELEIPLPSLSEQQQIVEYLDEQTGLIDKTISIEEKRIELLKEYRQSLISEVVTGKRKVVE